MCPHSINKGQLHLGWILLICVIPDLVFSMNTCLHSGATLQLSFTNVTGTSHRLKAVQNTVRIVVCFHVCVCLWDHKSPGSMCAVVWCQKEMLLCEGHLVSTAGHSDEWETFLWCPWAHHLWHILLLCWDLNLRTGTNIQSMNIISKYFKDLWWLSHKSFLLFCN